MRHNIFQIFILVVVLLPFSIVQSQDNNTLVYAAAAGPATLNPVLKGGTSDTVPIKLLFADLFDWDAETGLPIPGLVESWEISDDSLTYTFTLRDAQWSDGTPISSADAKFTFDAYTNPQVAAPQGGFLANVEGLTVIDDKTFEVKLKTADCALFANFNPALVPAHKFQPDYSDFNTSPFNTNPDVVSGPYMLTEWRPDEFLRFTANPMYWKGQPQIENLLIRILPDPTVMLQSLRAGESDYAWMFADQTEAVADAENLNILRIPATGMLYLSMNWSDRFDGQPAYDESGNLNEQKPHPIFSDVLVRQAITMAYNKAELLASLGGGTLVASTIPPTSWAYDPDLLPRSYDPEAAAALLDEAGWVLNPDTGVREKDGTPLAFELLYNPSVQMFQTMALIVDDQLGQLGIDVTLMGLEGGAFRDRFVKQEYDAMVISGGVAGDPAGWFDFFIHSTKDAPGAGFNWDSYVNLEVDRLSEEARTVPGCKIENRLPLYQELNRIVFEDVARDYVLLPDLAFVVNKRIQGFKPTYGNTRSDSFFPDIEQWSLAE